MTRAKLYVKFHSFTLICRYNLGFLRTNHFYFSILKHGNQIQNTAHSVLIVIIVIGNRKHRDFFVFFQAISNYKYITHKKGLTWTSSLRLLCDRSKCDNVDRWQGLSFSIVARWDTVLPVRPHCDRAMCRRPSGLFASPDKMLIAPANERNNTINVSLCL